MDSVMLDAIHLRTTLVMKLEDPGFDAYRCALEMTLEMLKACKKDDSVLEYQLLHAFVGVINDMLGSEAQLKMSTNTEMLERMIPVLERRTLSEKYGV